VNESKQATDPSEVRSAGDQLLIDNAAIIEEMRGKHDEIAIFPAPKGFDGVIIVAAPAPKALQNYVNGIADPKLDKAVETWNFAAQAVVHPDKATVRAMFAKKGMLPFKIAARAQVLAGAEIEELGKD
jgi:hypothetical protein